MNIVVCVKQVIDTEAVIELDSEESVVREGQALAIDPYGEFALEKAVQLKEACGGEVVVLSVGDQECVPVLRHALAMGADRVLLAEVEGWTEQDASVCAEQLAQIIEGLEADLIMGGWKSGDTANAQVMARLADRLDVPCANMVTALEPIEEGVLVTCEVDDGLVVSELKLPAVIGAQQGLAEPRYPSVRDVMQARKKPITECATVQVERGENGKRSGGLKVISRTLKPARAGGRMIEGDDIPSIVGEAVRLLRFEAKVI